MDYTSVSVDGVVRVMFYGWLVLILMDTFQYVIQFGLVVHGMIPEMIDWQHEEACGNDNDVSGCVNVVLHVMSVHL